MELAIISDTHTPRRERLLPGACVRILRAADLIVHGGDGLRLSFLRELEA